MSSFLSVDDFCRRWLSPLRQFDLAQCSSVVNRDDALYFAVLVRLDCPGPATPFPTARLLGRHSGARRRRPHWTDDLAVDMFQDEMSESEAERWSRHFGVTLHSLCTYTLRIWRALGPLARERATAE